jgi:hypothetical protein
MIVDVLNRPQRPIGGSIEIQNLSKCEVIYTGALRLMYMVLPLAWLQLHCPTEHVCVALDCTVIIKNV